MPVFTALSSIFLPYRDINVANNSEASTFIQFEIGRASCRERV